MSLVDQSRIPAVLRTRMYLFPHLTLSIFSINLFIRLVYFQEKSFTLSGFRFSGSLYAACVQNQVKLYAFTLHKYGYIKRVDKG